jgi:nicotinamide mononucleotide transporter
MQTIEIVGALTGVLAVWLTTRQKIWCWPTGIVSVLLYVFVFYQARLYATMGLQVVYVGLAVYGWYAWTKGGRADGPLRVSRASRPTLAAAFGVGLAVALGLGTWLGRQTDESLPFADAAVTSFSLVAQWMQTRKLIENWWLWLAVDVVYVGINLSQGLLSTAGLYAIYTALAVAGLREWRRSMEAM